MKTAAFTFFFILLLNPAKAQLKFILDDFEGLANGSSDLKLNGFFTFGTAKASVEQNAVQADPGYAGKRHITIKSGPGKDPAGWGKGIGLNIELDPNQDYLNFYVCQPAGNDSTALKIQLQEDDNEDKIYKKEHDDTWICFSKINPVSNPGNWQLLSMPLSKFKDGNPGGDGIFNCTYKKGKLLCIIISFENNGILKESQTISFDFICFSKGALPVSPGSVNASDGSCSLGLWSKEEPPADFTQIAKCFNGLYTGSEKKLAVIHFFQSFSTKNGDGKNYSSVDQINKIVQEGYIPMITLEDHFANLTEAQNRKQPNLYSIVEGHLDPFFTSWANQLKQVKGPVLLRILHEFNGNWYPWCIANNDQNPELLINAFRHIRSIFKNQQATNVKFIWCPNSMSVPQEKWNYIIDAYPGDEYVDFVGLDIYNGAGKESLAWRSFRKEGIENYFNLTQLFPGKPLLVCETACKEQNSSARNTAQTKAEWIEQMNQSLRSDMSKIKLLTWFNEKESFKINSSAEAKNAFLKYVLKDHYFKSGTTYLAPLIR